MTVFNSNDDHSLVPLELLGGRTATDLFPLNNIVVLSWILIVFAPRWRHTMTLAIIGPVIMSSIYGLSMLSMIMYHPLDPAPDFFTLTGVATMFQDQNMAYIGWAHFAAFDTFVGVTMVQNSIARRASTLQHIFFVVPCLVLTCFAGPVGFLIYTLLKHIVLASREEVVLDDETLIMSLNYRSPSKKFE